MPGKEIAMSQPSAVEYVRSLSIEDREAVFMDLLKECIAANAPLDVFEFDNGKENLGFYFSNAAVDGQFKAFGPKFTAEQQAEIDRRCADLSDAIPIAEIIEDLKREAELLQRSGALQSAS
jgi:hypothetical protein